MSVTNSSFMRCFLCLILLRLKNPHTITSFALCAEFIIRGMGDY